MLASKIHSSSWPENCIKSSGATCLHQSNDQHCSQSTASLHKSHLHLAKQLPAYTNPSTFGQSTASLCKSHLHLANQLPAYASHIYIWPINCQLTQIHLHLANQLPAYTSPAYTWAMSCLLTPVQSTCTSSVYTWHRYVGHAQWVGRRHGDPVQHRPCRCSETAGWQEAAPHQMYCPAWNRWWGNWTWKCRKRFGIQFI